MLFDKIVIDYNSIILFVHIPKSGGSTVRENLLRYFKKDQVLRVSERNLNHYLGKEINSYHQFETTNPIKKWLKSFSLTNKVLKLRNNIKELIKEDFPYNKNFYSLTSSEIEKLRFISSSQERNVVPPILGKNFIQIMTIRNPVDRIQSYYFQTKKKDRSDSKNQKRYAFAANKYDINDFIKYLYDNRPYMVNNPYSVCLSGTEDFTIAKEIIDTKFFLAAPMERMEEFSKVLLSKIFSKNETFIPFNIGHNNPKKIIISDNLIDLIISTNQADINLKKHVEIEFDKIIKNYEYKF